MRKIAVLGSTGSVGRQALEIIASSGGKLKAAALSANKNCELLIEQAHLFKPDYVAYSGENDISHLLPENTVLFSGASALKRLAAEAEYDILLDAVVGIAGLLPAIEAIKRGKTLALANKETLVSAGKIVTDLAKRHNALIIPVDSEHSAVWQALKVGKAEDVARLIITASGGAFRDVPLDKLYFQKAADALKHPNWAMGNRITIDSATMVNKGFEVIEAMHLFSVPLEKIKVVMHRESIVHSMVEYSDGSVIAQLATPDMRLPLSLALYYPERADNAVKKINFDLLELHFGTVDYNRYPLFTLALSAADKGGIIPAVLNAADEIAVEYYLKGNITYKDLHRLIENAAVAFGNNASPTLEDILDADKEARSFVKKAIGV